MQNRVDKLREKMIQNNIDCAIINNIENRMYFSGFTGSDGYLVVTHNKSVLITDSRYTEQAQQQSDFEILECKQNTIDLIKELVINNNIQNIGIEEQHLTYSQFKSLSQKLSTAFNSLDQIIQEVRAVKDQNEIENIKKAVKIGEDAFSHMLDFIKPGMTEISIAIELEFFMRKNGAQALSFESIVASGYRSSLPHGEPSDNIVKNGDFIVLDFGCKVNGYCSDMTRTIAIGQVSDEQRKVYQTVLEAQLKAIDEIREGVIGSNIDKIARDHISDNGYGEYFGHALGHGVGLNVHETPTLSVNNNKPLKANMIVTVEPGIYIPNFGGVRIEDMVIIKEDGLENLMESSKELIIL